MRVCVLIFIHTRIHMYSVLCALILFAVEFPINIALGIIINIDFVHCISTLSLCVCVR